MPNLLTSRGYLRRPSGLSQNFWSERCACPPSRLPSSLLREFGPTTAHTTCCHTRFPTEWPWLRPLNPLYLWHGMRLLYRLYANVSPGSKAMLQISGISLFDYWAWRGRVGVIKSAEEDNLLFATLVTDALQCRAWLLILTHFSRQLSYRICRSWKWESYSRKAHV